LLVAFSSCVQTTTPTTRKTHVPNVEGLAGVYRDDPTQFLGGIDGGIRRAWSAGQAGRVRGLRAVEVRHHL